MRYVVWTVLVMASHALRAAMTPFGGIWANVPDMTLACLVALSMFARPVDMAIFGAVSGLLVDVTSAAGAIGSMSVFYLIIAPLSAYAFATFEKKWLPVLLASAGALTLRFLWQWAGGYLSGIRVPVYVALFRAYLWPLVLTVAVAMLMYVLMRPLHRITFMHNPIREAYLHSNRP